MNGGPPQARGEAGGRLRSVLLIGSFVGLLLIGLVIVTAIVTARDPGPPLPDCPDPSQPCSGPPSPSPPVPPTPGPQVTLPPQPPDSNAPLLLHGGLWESTELGYHFQFDPAIWAIRDQDGRTVSLDGHGGYMGFGAIGAPATEATPQQMLDQRLSALSQAIVGLAPQTQLEKLILGVPMVGFIDGVGGVYTGTLDTPQGPSTPVDVAVLAASDGLATVVVVMVVPSEDREYGWQEADTILNSFRWPSGLR